ncbi:MAG: transketolase family protein [Proteobacteria bacterium]|nr:transketolase family protein [Pseudomonadota bacterium]MBU4471479.1 transketolase family protein [Pseudomonadota bacterium]MCG2752485.1 transketolase family protein [Desulfobacteraceae bacterium]
MEKESLRTAFGKSLVQLAPKYDNFVVFDADVAGGTCTHLFRNAFPDRFYQFGIAEQNMMSAAAGFSTEGIIPFVTCYAVFASMRAIEQARNSIAYPDYNVKIVASHVGIDVGPDGVSHQAIEDLAIYRSIPNFKVISPADDMEVYQATESMINTYGPIYMRTGRSEVPKVNLPEYKFKIGKGTVLREGADITIVATGIMVHRALEAAQQLSLKNIDAAVLNISTIKPIDKELLNTYSKKTGKMVTCEDHNIHGGLFSAVLEAISSNPVPVFPIAIKDVFAESGDSFELAKKYNIDSKDIYQLCIEVKKNETFR